jgi:enoyl-CoA hydratase
MEDFKDIILEVEGPAAILTFNRPKRLNAMGKGIIDETARAADLLTHKKDLKVLIITGAGGNFSSGLDVIDMAEVNESEGLRLIRAGIKIYDTIHKLNQVTIAAVEGYCLGGGLDVALSCDILVSSKSAKFGEPDIDFSVLPGIARVWRHTGLNRARYMAMTGEIFSADVMNEWGMISVMTGAGKALSEAKRIAKRLIEKPNYALRTVKRLFSEVMEMQYDEASQAEKDAFLELYKTEERALLMKAFKDKRKTGGRG